MILLEIRRVTVEDMLEALKVAVSLLLVLFFSNSIETCEETYRPESIAMLRGTSSVYLDITHKYLYEDGLKVGDDIALSVANSTVILDFSQRDNITFPAVIQTFSWALT